MFFGNVAGSGFGGLGIAFGLFVARGTDVNVAFLAVVAAFGSLCGVCADLAFEYTFALSGI